MSDVYFHIHEIRQAQMSLSHMLVTCDGHPSILSNTTEELPPQPRVWSLQSGDDVQMGNGM